MIARSAKVLMWLLVLCAAAVGQQYYYPFDQAPPPLNRLGDSIRFRAPKIERQPIDGSLYAEYSHQAVVEEQPHGQHTFESTDLNFNGGHTTTSEPANSAEVVGAELWSTMEPNQNLTVATATTDEDCCLPRVWVSADYVHWWLDGSDVPALITTSDAGTPRELASRVNLPTTTTLFGGQELNEGSRSGARFTLGSWLDLYNRFGFELNFLILGNDDTRFNTPGDLEILGRPFFHLLNDEQDAKLIQFPGVVQGTMQVEMKSEFLTGEALLRKRVAGWGARQVDWYIGYRHAGLIDDIRINENSIIEGGPAAGTVVSIFDQFRTRNTFHGVNLGVRVGTLLRPTLEVEILGKVAVGTTRTETEIFGGSTTSIGGATTNTDIGFLVQPTNAGVFEDDSFSTISEFAIATKCMFRPGLNLVVGYNLLFWHDVNRAGAKIDSTINTSQLPPGVLSGEARPSVRNVRSNFWAHGVRIGFEYLF